MYGCMDGWMDVWIYYVYVSIYIYVYYVKLMFTNTDLSIQACQLQIKHLYPMLSAASITLIKGTYYLLHPKITFRYH